MKLALKALAIYVTTSTVYAQNTCDTRKLVSKVTDKRILQFANSVAARVADVSLDHKPLLKQYKLNKIPFQVDGRIEGQQICSSELTMHSPKSLFASCSGVLVGKDLLLTAGHCIQNRQECKEGYWVFNHIQTRDSIPAKDVYKCKDVVKYKSNVGSEDYLLIKLDRSVEGRSALKVAAPQTGMNVFTLGFPMSSVMTHSSAVVSEVSALTLKTTMSIMQGNSGGPIIDYRTGAVVGIVSQLHSLTSLFQKKASSSPPCLEFNFCNSISTHTRADKVP